MCDFQEEGTTGKTVDGQYSPERLQREELGTSQAKGTETSIGRGKTQFEIQNVSPSRNGPNRRSEAQKRPNNLKKLRATAVQGLGRIVHNTTSAIEGQDRVKRWIQKTNQEIEIQERRKKSLEVYKRRETSSNNRGRLEKGPIIREPVFHKKRYAAREYQRKLKKAQSENDLDYVNSSSDQEALEWGEIGQCSGEGGDTALAMIPVDTTSMVEEELTTYSQRSSEFWSSFNGTIEERATRWILENVIHLGRALGVTFHGREEEAIQMIREIEERGTSSIGEGSKRSRPSKANRELKGLKCEINYEGKKTGNEKSSMRFRRRQTGGTSYD